MKSTLSTSASSLSALHAAHATHHGRVDKRLQVRSHRRLHQRNLRAEHNEDDPYPPKHICDIRSSTALRPKGHSPPYCAAHLSIRPDQVPVIPPPLNAKNAALANGVKNHGGDEGARTLDPHVANVVLSQLSYIPINRQDGIFLPSVALVKHKTKRKYKMADG